MLSSTSIKSLAKALVLAKAKMEAPHKNKTNPHFKNMYADLAAVKASYQPALGDNGLSVIHSIALNDGHLTLTTSLIHAESGEWIASDYPIPAGLKPQETGSAVSYGRRYNVCALLDIVAEDDDDGNAAQNGAAKAQEKAPEKSVPPSPPLKSSPGDADGPARLTRGQVEAVHLEAKKRGYPTPAAFAPVLKNIVGVEKTTDVLAKDFVVLMDALHGMTARERVPA